VSSQDREEKKSENKDDEKNSMKDKIETRWRHDKFENLQMATAVC